MELLIGNLFAGFTESVCQALYAVFGKSLSVPGSEANGAHWLAQCAERTTNDSNAIKRDTLEHSMSTLSAPEEFLFTVGQ